MPFAHGKNTVIKLESNAVPCTTSAFGRSQDMHDVSQYGDDSHAFYAGLANGTFTMSGVYDSTATTGSKAVFEAIIAAQIADGSVSTTITRQPIGTGSGKAQEVFEAFLSSYTETDPVNDMVTWQADWQISGGVDPTAQSA